MQIAVPAEARPGECRVALTPEAVADLVRRGYPVVVRSGAGAGMLAADADYLAAGAEVRAGDVLDGDVHRGAHEGGHPGPDVVDRRCHGGVPPQHEVHLREAVEIDPQTREWAARDEDFDSIRDDPEFPR